MKEITEEVIKNVISTSKNVLVSTHSILSIPVIRRIYKKMKLGLKFDSIKVYNSLIIDGHHRYVSSLLSEVELNSVMSHKTSATRTYAWEDVSFTEEEWDTKEKIKLLNELDAEFNNIALDKIIELTK